MNIQVFHNKKAWSSDQNFFLKKFYSKNFPYQCQVQQPTVMIDHSHQQCYTCDKFLKGHRHYFFWSVSAKVNFLKNELIPTPFLHLFLHAITTLAFCNWKPLDIASWKHTRQPCADRKCSSLIVEVKQRMEWMNISNLPPEAASFILLKNYLIGPALGD